MEASKIEWAEQDKSGQTIVTFSEKGTKGTNRFCKSKLLDWAHSNGRRQQLELVAGKVMEIWGVVVTICTAQYDEQKELGLGGALKRNAHSLPKMTNLDEGQSTHVS